MTRQTFLKIFDNNENNYFSLQNNSRENETTQINNNKKINFDKINFKQS